MIPDYEESVVDPVTLQLLTLSSLVQCFTKMASMKITIMTITTGTTTGTFEQSS